jgi:hypothetical protein
MNEDDPDLVIVVHDPDRIPRRGADCLNCGMCADCIERSIATAEEWELGGES